MMSSVDTSTNTLMLPLSSLTKTLTKPTSGRSCRTFISIYPVQPEDWIHSIIATLHSKMPTKPTHCRLLGNRTMPPFSSHKQRIVQVPPVEKEVTRWSSHSEATLQAALDDVDWDMFRASSSDVSEFTEVALSCQHANRTGLWVTIRTFSNQKPWVDRIGQIGLLMMPSPRSCTCPSLTLTAQMATMSGCYSLTIAQLSTL